ncbi:SspB family protein [Yunchengibacter salinarum]|uniref:SspB family protein n=1 Tax=Yunchengibacter salinarum TaxID=3133399 RepID=UPI0035B5D6B9
MTDTPSESSIDYDAKVEAALKTVVRSVLRDTVEHGLPGDHHFFIAFRTQAEGVSIPAHLVSRFPEEMTIVIQHKFWDLTVEDDHFEVGLSFNQKPEHLIIPFHALTGFVDPSVQFALNFHAETGAEHDDATDGATSQSDEAGDTRSGRDMASLEATVSDLSDLPRTAASRDDMKTEDGDNNADGDARGGDNVVTLDAFRKKT